MQNNKKQGKLICSAGGEILKKNVRSYRPPVSGELEHLQKTFNENKTKVSAQPSNPEKMAYHFMLFHQNVQSLNNKLAEIEIMLSDELIDVSVLCMTEHWLREDALQTVNITNYELAAYTCRKQILCGGICIFVKKGLTYKHLEQLNTLNNEKDFEISAIELPSLKTTVICLYRSPDGDTKTFLQNMENTLTQTVKNKQTIIFCGDFNIDFKGSSKVRTELMNILVSYNLKITIHSPTRVTRHTKSTIDQIIINSTQEQYKAETVKTGLGDHYGQTISFDIKSDKDNKLTTTYKTRTYNDQEIEIFRNCLKSESWEQIFDTSTGNISEKFDIFIDRVKYHFDIAFPVKTRRSKNTLPNKWITMGIRKSCANKRFLYRITKMCDTTPEFDRYFKNYKTVLKNVIKSAKKLENDRYIRSASNKTRAVWNIVKKETGNNKTKIKNIQLNENLQTTSKPKEVANMFNTYFINVAEKLIEKNVTHDPPSQLASKIKQVDKSIFLIPTTIQEVQQEIKLLKSKHSSGIDNIPDFLVKTCVDLLSEPLTHLVNLSFSTGSFPTCLKIAKVKPLHKKGSQEEVSNYRPVSLLSVFSKILEKLFYKRLSNFLSKYNILTESQHGFRKNHSTETAVFSFLYETLQALDRREHTTSIFLDLSKAFDTINHDKLLSKIQNWGIRGTAHNWIKSYLHNRKQLIEITHESNGTVSTYHSDLLEVKHGVPQGSILGPVLFLLYVNDLHINSTNGKLYQFADDTSILITGSAKEVFESNIEAVTKSIRDYFDANGLIINLEKTVAMDIFTTQNRSPANPHMEINGKTIQKTESTKFLGIWIQQNIKWDTHVEYINKKLSKTCYIMRTLKNCISYENLKSIYFAYAHSQMKYGIVFWGNSGVSVKTFRIQKKIVRIMEGVDQRASCKPLFKKNKILPLPCMYILENVIIIKEKLNGGSPHLTRNELIHSHHTRQKNDVHVIQTNTALFQKGILHPGIKLYNALPKSTKAITGTNKFKTAIKDYLVKHCFYSVDEYLEEQNSSSS